MNNDPYFESETYDIETADIESGLDTIDALTNLGAYNYGE